MPSQYQRCRLRPKSQGFYTVSYSPSFSYCKYSTSAQVLSFLSFTYFYPTLSDGVIQPYSQLNWWVWMYRLSPFTYLIEGNYQLHLISFSSCTHRVIKGLLGQAIGHQQITCSSKEYSTLQPPSGSTCASYLATYISNKGGYLLNPDATSACQFCSSRTTDQFFGPKFNISYDHRWRNVGLFCAYIVFNVSALTHPAIVVLTFVILDLCGLYLHLSIPDPFGKSAWIYQEAYSFAQSVGYEL